MKITRGRFCYVTNRKEDDEMQIKLHPKGNQIQSLKQLAGTHRFVYNWALIRQADNLEAGGNTIPFDSLYIDLQRLSYADENMSWLVTTPDILIEEAITDFRDDYEAYLNEQQPLPSLLTKRHTPYEFAVQPSLNADGTAFQISGVPGAIDFEGVYPFAADEGARIRKHNDAWYLTDTPMSIGGGLDE